MKHFFADKDPNDDISIVRNKSNFTPKKGINSRLDRYIDNLTKFPLIPKKGNQVKSNISKSQQKAISRLQNDNSIIIKEADKGGAIVIMDKEYYQHKIQEQLGDTNSYRELNENIDRKTMRSINQLISKFPECTTEKEEDFLRNFDVKSSNFYGLPKVHKSEEIKTAITEQNSAYIELKSPEDLKFRPIVAGPQCPTHRLSNFLDIILKPICQFVPSFIRDDLDFLNHIPTNVDNNAILVSFDVTSLYTSIPHELGLEATEFWLEKHRNVIDTRFTTQFLLSALKLILENNSFYFNGRYYLQISGTAMGTKVAPTYATLVMGFLEDKMYKLVESTFNLSFSKYIKEQWKRFLDDCFIIWTKNRDELNLFQNLLNNINPSIQFTMETDNNQLPFLDILVTKADNRITTDIYYKNTDTHQYLDFSSCHPSHTKRNIPFCLARRICTIVTEDGKRNERLNELRVFLKKQKYPDSLIDMGIDKAKTIPLAELRSTVRREKDENIIPYVSTHNPCNPNLYNVIRTTLPIMHESERLKELFPEKTFIQSKRQPKNLKRILTRAKFDGDSTKNFSVDKCHDARCGMCPNIIVGDSITLLNGKTVTPNENLNCKSKNLIYIITCSTCKENYIGQTGNSICERIRIHRQQIQNPNTRMIPLSEHLDVCGHGNFKVFPFYKMNDSDVNNRLLKEKHFMKIFKPKLNH